MMMRAVTAFLGVLAASAACPAPGSLDSALAVRASTHQAAGVFLAWDARHADDTELPFITFAGGETTDFLSALTAKCFTFAPGLPVWSASVTDACKPVLGLAEISPAGEGCELATVDLVRTETTIEVKLRFSEACKSAGGLTFLLLRGGKGPVFTGLFRWVCAVMGPKCHEPLKTTAPEVEDGSTTISITSKLKPLLSPKGEAGPCDAPGADVQKYPDSNEEGCKVTCIGRGEVTANVPGQSTDIALTRQEHCIAYAFNSATHECELFLVPHGNHHAIYNAMHVTVEDPHWSCTAVEPSDKADMADDAPEVETAHTVLDTEAPLVLPADPSGVATPFVAQSVVLLAAEPCPPSTWYTNLAAMAVTEQEWAELEQRLPIVPPGPHSGLSMTVGKACVCFAASCSSCDPLVIPPTFYAGALMLMIIAAIIGGWVVWNYCPKKPDADPWTVKEVVLQSRDGSTTTAPITVTYDDHNVMKTHTLYSPLNTTPRK
jgi:hypothetical protein